MNEIDYAYCAGIIDGEGSILLAKSGTTRHPAISVTNTSLPMLEFLRSLFGGSIRKQKTYKPHHKEAWVWGVSYQRAMHMIDCILPYMKDEEKVRRAIIIIDEWNDATPSNGRYTDELLALKEAIIYRFFNGDERLSTALVNSVKRQLYR
jgi:hypothetical protein